MTNLQKEFKEIQNNLKDDLDFESENADSNNLLNSPEFKKQINEIIREELNGQNKD